MKLALLAFNFTSTKKLASTVLVVLFSIVCLPMGAVFAFTNIPELGFTALVDGSSASSGAVYNDPITPGDGYEYGYCTYWAQLRRIQNGDPIPNHWGDAISWYAGAILNGYQVDQTPLPGAIFQWPDAPGGLGHVAYVERVDPTSGAWTISEMNANGWDVVDNRTYPASQAKDYNFIHDKVDRLNI